MRITVLSLACCNPALAVYDREYLSRIGEALKRTAIEAQVDLLSASDAFFGVRSGHVRKLWPLFNKYGTAVAPALFINDELMLYGGVPSVERLVEIIDNAKKRTVEPPTS